MISNLAWFVAGIVVGAGGALAVVAFVLMRFRRDLTRG
jgi:hypothetical protein